MLPENRVTTHPGEILKEEFLDPLGITQVAFAAHIGVPLQRVTKLCEVNGVSRPKLRGFFLKLWNTPHWMNLQVRMI
jgi:addiction module HigA family antidote